MTNSSHIVPQYRQGLTIVDLPEPNEVACLQHIREAVAAMKVEFVELKTMTEAFFPSGWQ